MPTNQFLATHVESNAHSSEIFSIALAANRAITASGDTSIRVWDAKAPEHPLVHTFEDAHSLGAHHVVVDVNNGGTTAASSGFGQEVVLWDLAKGKEKLRLDPKDGTDDQKMPDTIGKTWALEFSPDANVLYTTSYHGRIVLWDTRSFKRITEVETKGFFGMTVAASGDGRYFASGHKNGGIYVFSTETNRILYTLSGHSTTVRSLSFSPGSNYLAATGDSKIISVYDVHYGEQIAHLTGHHSPTLSVDWNRSGEYLLSSSLDGRLKVWDFEQKACVATQTESTSTIWSAKWSRSSEGFIAGGADKSLYWYIAAGV